MRKPIGGKIESLDTEAARISIDEHVAGPLGLEVMAAAEAIIRVANSRMAGAIRLVSIERGHDPKKLRRHGVRRGGRPARGRADPGGGACQRARAALFPV